MKKINLTISSISIILLSSLLILAYSCSREQEGNKSQKAKTELKESAAEPPGIISITCTGNCEDGSQCYAVVNGNTGKIHCECEPCKMKIDKSNTDKNTITKADMPKMMQHFLDYIKKTHKTESYGITEFSHSFYEDSELVRIFYIINDDFSYEYSLVFVVKYQDGDSKAQQPPSTVLVDCHGSCDDSNKECAEVYDPITQKISCGCAGDNCKMAIED